MIFRTLRLKTMIGWIALALLFPGYSTDWPQWRGPERSGKSGEKGLLAAWPDGGPPLLWRISGLGAGYSSLSVSKGRIFTMGDLDGGQHVIAISSEDGKLLWKSKVGPVWNDRYGGARGTPTVDGNRVYAVSTEGGLVCLDAENGKEIWSRNLPEDFGGKMSAGQDVHWKFSESPLVDGNKVLVTPGSADAAIVALDKNTGKEIWRTKTPDLGEKGADGAAYSSIVVSNGAGVRQYVQMLGRGVVGVDDKTGKLLWSYNRVANNVANIPTPIISSDHVFVSTGYNTGSALLKLVRDGDRVRAEEVYFLEGNQLQNHHGGLILVDGHIYTGTGHNKGFPICVNLANGEALWGPERNQGQGSAAASFADGHLYFRYQNGLMVLIEATPEAYREKGSFMIPDVDNFSWSHPVISGGKLYLREQNNLFCYNISK